MPILKELSFLTELRKEREREQLRKESGALKDQKLADLDIAKFELDQRRAGVEDAIALKKAADDSKVANTEVLGKELDNKGKKLELTAPMIGPQTPAGPQRAPTQYSSPLGGPETPPGALTPKPADKAKQLKLEANKPPSEADDKVAIAQAVSEGAGSGLPSVPSMPWANRGRELGTQPFDVQSFAKMRKESREGLIQRGVENLEEQNAIRESYNEARRAVINKQMRGLEYRRFLSDNPASFKSAVKNLNWVQKIVGVVHAMTAGYLYENPTQLLDQYINEELFDLKQKRKDELDILKFESNMYERNLKLLGSEFQAEIGVKQSMFDFIKNQLNLEANSFSKDVGAIEKLSRFNSDIEMRQETLNRQSLLDQRDEVDKNFKRNLELRKTAIEEAKLMKADSDEAEKSRKAEKHEWERGKHTIRVGRFVDTSATPHNVKKFADLLAGEGKSIRLIHNIERVVKSISASDLKALTPLGAYSSASVRASRAKLLRMNDLFKRISLGSRIETTGGGNMSEYEQKMLEQLYEYKRKGWLGDSGKFMKMFGTWGKGDYDSLVNLLKKMSFNSVLANAEQRSPKFASLSTAEKYAEVGRQIGMKKEANQYWQDYKRYSGVKQ